MFCLYFRDNRSNMAMLPRTVTSSELAILLLESYDSGFRVILIHTSQYLFDRYVAAVIVVVVVMVVVVVVLVVAEVLVVLVKVVVAVVLEVAVEVVVVVVVVVVEVVVAVVVVVVPMSSPRLYIDALFYLVFIS